MKRPIHKLPALSAAVAAIALGAGATIATATEPCDDFDECKVLIEINATDGDIGFHFLMDAEDLNSAKIQDPDGDKVFEDKAKGPLKEQKLTETFAESAEPFCWDSPDREEDEEIVTLEEFLERWTAGTYLFSGRGDEGEKLMGETELTHDLPAAPTALTFNPVTGLITWAPGTELGNCASFAELTVLVINGVLENHPAGVPVAAWEVVFEPDVEDGDPTGQLKFTIRVAGDITTKAVTVPAEYLADLPANTPAKIEVGAIGADDNATFTEVDGFCINDENGGCD